MDPTLFRELIPHGVLGLLFAALAGAVISTLASVLNSASTILTMDLWKRHWRPGAAEIELVLVGRIATVVFLGMACAVAVSPILQGRVFRFIQEFQGYVSPGILAAFAFGFAVPKARPRPASPRSSSALRSTVRCSGRWVRSRTCTGCS